MKLRLTKNVAINVDPTLNSQVAGFYESLGLEAKSPFPGFTSLGPSPYSFFVVSWEPKPKGTGEICLQFETDELLDVKEAAERLGAEIVFYGEDENSPGKKHAWLRDPAGVLINVIEAS